MSQYHQSTSRAEPSLQQTLDEFDQHLRKLTGRITTEQQAWEDHLTASRANGPHRLGHGTQIRSIPEAEREAAALSEQTEAYNTRIRAMRQRGIDHDEVDWTDLLDPDEGSPLGTEMASTFLRRIILSARLELNILAASLCKQEDVISFGFRSIGVLAASAAQIIARRRLFIGEEDSAFARGKAEFHILMLQASMAKVGMRMARQCVLPEFFDIGPHLDESLLHARLGEQADVETYHEDELDVRGGLHLGEGWVSKGCGNPWFDKVMSDVGSQDEEMEEAGEEGKGRAKR